MLEPFKYGMYYSFYVWRVMGHPGYVYKYISSNWNEPPNASDWLKHPPTMCLYRGASSGVGMRMRPGTEPLLI